MGYLTHRQGMKPGRRLALNRAIAAWEKAGGKVPGHELHRTDFYRQIEAACERYLLSVVRSGNEHVMRPCIGPDGREHESLKAAGAVEGVTPSAIYKRCHRKGSGWRLADEVKKPQSTASTQHLRLPGGEPGSSDGD